MIFRQKKIKKKEKIYKVLKIIIFWVDFVPQSQHPSHIIPNNMYHPQLPNVIPNAQCHPVRKMSSRTQNVIPYAKCHPVRKMPSRTQNVIPYAKCHPERCASSYALASKNDSGSHFFYHLFIFYW